MSEKCPKCNRAAEYYIPSEGSRPTPGACYLTDGEDCLRRQLAHAKRELEQSRQREAAANDYIDRCCALVKSPDTTNDGGPGLLDDIECLLHNYRHVTEREAVNSAVLAMVEEWRDKHLPIKERSAPNAPDPEADLLDAILSGSPDVLAVVDVPDGCDEVLVSGTRQGLMVVTRNAAGGRVIVIHDDSK